MAYHSGLKSTAYGASNKEKETIKGKILTLGGVLLLAASIVAGSDVPGIIKGVAGVINGDQARSQVATKTPTPAPSATVLPKN